MPTREHENVDDNTNKQEGEEDMHIQQAQKAIPKTNKPKLKSEGKQPIEQKDVQLSTGDALPEEKTSRSGQDVQMAPQQQPLKYEKGGNEKRMYQRGFITRMSIRSFSSTVDMMQIPRKFSKWVVESFDPYSTSFLLPDGQRFTVTPFDAYVILGMPFGGRKIMESSRSLTDKEYDEFIPAKKDGGESFKRNFIIYLVNCIFSGQKNHYCNWGKFAVQKLITNVMQYKDSKSVKGVHLDGPLLFLMMLHLNRDQHHGVNRNPTRESQLRSNIEHHGIKNGRRHLGNAGVVSFLYRRAMVEVGQRP
ncbi:hypothetical protein Cgig2_005293 [Carnegiea gigantea]|uniref:Uncharacterized protein n=1 Tax=Carnegiea gigantea TaxID=171969 RepID=A0A9Q1JJP6_9CARY|nr:hypothetical protein Cgig2_005293 [Carnegiea gigantea]